MLRNKYLLAALGGLLLLVLVYNIAFFSGRGKGNDRHSVILGTSEKADGGRILPVSAPAEEAGLAGEWRRDPFWYPGGKARSAAPATRKATGIHLEATMAESGKRYAIINSDIVGVGERFRGYIVAEIGDQFVKLKGPGGIKTLKLTGDSSEKE